MAKNIIPWAKISNSLIYKYQYTNGTDEPPYFYQTTINNYYICRFSKVIHNRFRVVLMFKFIVGTGTYLLINMPYVLFI